MLLCEYGPQVVKELLENRANVHHSTVWNTDSLWHALEGDHAMVVYLLLKHGAVLHDSTSRSKARKLLVQAGIAPAEAEELVGWHDKAPTPTKPHKKVMKVARGQGLPECYNKKSLGGKAYELLSLLWEEPGMTRCYNCFQDW